MHGQRPYNDHDVINYLPHTVVMTVDPATSPASFTSGHVVSKVLIDKNGKCFTGKQRVYFYIFKRPECFNQEVLLHSFIYLPLPYMEGIVLICNTDLYCVIVIFNDTGDMFNR